MSDVVTEEAARRFVAAVPGTGYVDIADAAHMVAGDKNDVFRSAVLDFLAELDRSAQVDVLVVVQDGVDPGVAQGPARSNGSAISKRCMPWSASTMTAVRLSVPAASISAKHIAHAGIGVANGGVEDLRMRPTGVPTGVGEVEREPAVAGERPRTRPPDMQGLVAGVGVVDRCVAELLHPHEVLGAVQTAVGVGEVGIGPFVVIWAMWSSRRRDRRIRRSWR